MASKFKQEMPPQSGYGPIEWAKVVRQRRFSGYTIFASFIGLTASSLAVMVYFKKKDRLVELEMQEARVALQPLITAERQRIILRRLRQNRDEENEIMKNVPGWETGTLYGQPVFHNQAKRFPNVSSFEYYVHSSPKDLYEKEIE